MRTTVLVATFLMLTGVARASEWGGTWTVEGGGTRTLDESGATLSLDVTLPVQGGTANFHLRGGAMGQAKLRLQGEGTKTVGVVGALSQQRGGGKYKATLDAELVDGSVNARFSVGSDPAISETWHRGNLEVVSLESDGKPLSGDFDAKLSETGLVVKYRAHVPLDLTAQVVVGDGHPYASFYADPVIFSAPLGAVEAGDHDFTWDGRDQTAAARIALGGPYRVVLVAGKEKADKGFSVAAPRFETVGSNWPKGTNASSPDWDWKPAEYLAGVSALVALRPLATVETAGKPSFAVSAPHILQSPDGVDGVLSRAASFVLQTHGYSGTVGFYDGTDERMYEPTPGTLKDVHFAFASCCETDLEYSNGSFCDKLVNAGCDVVIGYENEVFVEEGQDFVAATMALLTRGDPIQKTAEDMKTPVGANYELRYKRWNQKRAKSVAECMHVKFGHGIPPSESLWPPRYGNSKN
jgi:hypothetical protein